MGFKFRKGSNLGGKIQKNLSQTGIGCSWDINGYRIAKNAKKTTQRTAFIPGTEFSYTQKNSNYGRNSTNQATRQGMQAWAITCFVLAAFFAFISFDIGVILFGIAVFLAVLGTMLTVLSKSSKSSPYLLYKQFEMKKSTFVVICVTIAFCLFSIFVGCSGEMEPSSNGEDLSSALDENKNNTTVFCKFSPSFAIQELGDTRTITCYMQPSGLTEEDFVIENSDDSIISVTNIVLKNESDKTVLSFDITGVSVGKATIKIKSTDSKSESNELQFTINEKDTSPTVYVTPSGKKYHFSSSCAGKNAIKTTQNKAIRSGKGRCKKCG